MGREKEVLARSTVGGARSSLEEVSHSPGYDFRVGPWCSREGSARFGPGVATVARTGATFLNF